MTLLKIRKEENYQKNNSAQLINLSSVNELKKEGVQFFDSTLKIKIDKTSSFLFDGIVRMAEKTNHLCSIRKVEFGSSLAILILLSSEENNKDFLESINSLVNEPISEKNISTLSLEFWIPVIDFHNHNRDLGLEFSYYPYGHNPELSNIH